MRRINKPETLLAPVVYGQGDSIKTESVRVI